MKIISRKELEKIISEEQAVELLSQIPCEYTGIDFKFVGLPLTINVVPASEKTRLYHLVATAPTEDAENAPTISGRLREIFLISNQLEHDLTEGMFCDDTSIGRGYAYSHTIPVTKENTIRLKGNLLNIYRILDDWVKDRTGEGYGQIKHILDSTYEIWQRERKLHG